MRPPLALKWSDLDFVLKEINLRRGIVRQNIGEMKTEASQKPIPLDAGLAAVLMEWRGCCAYNQLEDWIFASPDAHGRQGSTRGAARAPLEESGAMKMSGVSRAR